ncbi:hypothetical protein [Nocardia sp. XZ_19_385]|uniref:hypothetical protein n=1 Tax=Nocardia sp. XZ_19_385 TaxID=2769488 RepID=UPI00188E5EBB|nr:hypothetical protein [Nocardia sp. XZ_19_385]
MNTIRARLGIATATLAVAGALTPLAAPAQAAPNCPWPFVCLYDFAGVKKGAFQDITAGYQPVNFAGGTGHNARRDDVVYLLDRNGTVGCIEPGKTASLPTPIKGLRISREARCFQ